MMLGLDPLQSHVCFASWLLLSLWLTKEAARHEEEEGICFFLTACYDLPVCFLFLCMVSWQHFFTQAAAAPFHSNSCIQCVVFPALGEPASDCSIPTAPLPDTSTGGAAASPQKSVSVHGDPPPNFHILMNSTSSLYFFMPWGGDFFLQLLQL